MRRPTLMTTAAFAAATLVMLGSTGAHAAGTQITVGGSSAPASVPATMDNTSDIIFETNFGVSTTCNATDADVTINRGAAVSIGSSIGTIDRLSLDCFTFGGLEYPVHMSMTGQNIVVRQDANAGDPIPVDIEVDAVVSSPGCNFTLAGSMRAALLPGDAPADGYLQLGPGLDMLVGPNADCWGEIVSGDLAEATGGTFAVTTSGPNAGPINHGAGGPITVDGNSAPASIPTTMDNTSDISFDTNFGVPMTCTDSDIDGTVARGAAVSIGNTVGTIDTLTLSNCLATDLDFPVIATMTAQDITVRDDAPAGDPIPVDIQVDAAVSGTGCNFTATGSVRGVINPGSGSPDGTIVLQPGYDLLIDTAGGSSTGSSCGGEVYAGDLAQATGGDFDLTTSGPNAGPINHG